LEDIVNAAMERQLAPVKTLLLEQIDRDPGLKDIIGGIGWIIGLAGLAAYYRQRRRGV
jgi:nickel transport protein